MPLVAIHQSALYMGNELTSTHASMVTEVRSRLGDSGTVMTSLAESWNWNAWPTSPGAKVTPPEIVPLWPPTESLAFPSAWYKATRPGIWPWIWPPRPWAPRAASTTGVDVNTGGRSGGGLMTERVKSCSADPPWPSSTRMATAALPTSVLVGDQVTVPVDASTVMPVGPESSENVSGSFSGSEAVAV